MVDASGLSVISGLFEIQTGIKQIATGADFNCVVFYTGKVRCWGENEHGQLGYNHAVDIGDGIGPSIVASADVPVGEDVDSIACGSDHTCAVTKSGNVRCWGLGENGRLGYGDEDNIADGIGDSIIGAGDLSVGGTVIQISVGGTHTCALLTDNTVRCWGDNNMGSIGPLAVGHIGDEPGELPVAAMPLGSNAVSIAAGQIYGCMINDSNDLRCWGSNNFGELGYGNTVDIDSAGQFPPNDINVGGLVVQVGVNYEFAGTTCVRTSTGGLRCWGSGSYGKLAYGSEDVIGDGPGEMPPPDGLGVDANLGGLVEDFDIGAEHICAILTGGGVRCWGLADFGRLGYDGLVSGSIGNSFSELPPPDGVGINVNLPEAVLQIATGETHSCALLQSGKVICWGEGASGRLGYNNTNNVGDGVGPNVGAQGYVPIY